MFYTKEQIKIVLNNQFKDINNEAADYVLQRISKSLSHTTNAGECGVDSTEYAPILIDECGLMMMIRVFHDNMKRKLYREIWFDDDVAAPKYKGCSTLSVGQEFYLSEEHTIELNNEKVEMCHFIVKYEVMGDFRFVEVKDKQPNGALYNVMTNEITLLGNYKDRSNDRELDRNQKNPDALVKWEQAVEEASHKNPLFMQAAQRCLLKDLLSRRPSTALRVLILISEYPALLQLHSLPNVYNCLKRRAEKSVDERMDDLSQLLKELNLKGETPGDVLNIPDYFAEHIDKCSEILTYKQMLALVVDIRDVQRLSSAKTQKEYELLTDILSLKTRKKLDKRDICYLTYLINTGFSLVEIEQYLRKIWYSQAIKAGDALKAWFELIHAREILTGSRQKYFPKNVATELALLDRSIENMTKDIRLSFIDNVRKSRVKFNDKNASNEIIPNREEKMDDLSISHHVRCILRHTEFLVYKKCKSNKEAVFAILGDGIFVDVYELGVTHLKVIESWAKKRNLYLNRI